MTQGGTKVHTDRELASGIGGEKVESLIEGDFKEHSSLNSVSTMMTASNNAFCFRPVTYHEVKDAMDKINSRKAADITGYNCDFPGSKPRVD